MIVRCLDLESTGIPDEETSHAIVEVGYCDLDTASGSIGAVTSFLVNPKRPIPIEATAIHHIRDDMVADLPGIDRHLTTMMAGADAFAAHRADFERRFFGGGDRPWLCSLKSALRVWPEAEGHGVSALRYVLRLHDDPTFDEAQAMPPHRAGPDAYVCAHILRRILRKTTVENVLKWSSGPALLAKVTFGKHANMRWKDVPADYLAWIVEKSDFTDRDVRATAKYYLRQKREAATVVSCVPEGVPE